MHNGWTGGQFSLIRALVGLCLLGLLAWQAVVAAAWPVALLAAAGAVLSVALIVGWRREPVVGLWAVVTGLGIALADRPSAAVLVAIGALVLLVIAALPTGPYGALPARGRADPGGGWRYPAWAFAAMWIVVAGLFFLWGLSLLLDPGWRVAERGMALTVLGLPRDHALSIAADWSLLGAWLLMAPLAAWRVTRPIGWALVLIVNVVVLSLAGHGALVAPLVMLSLLTLDPAWLPARPKGARDVVFYDGHCGLCHRWVRFVLAEDADGELFELAPLQSEYFEMTVSSAERESLPDSIVLRRASGALLVKSTAVLAILDRLGGYWRIVSWLCRLVPRALRDVVYDGVARVRLKLFAQPVDACPMVPAHLRARFRM